MVVRILMLSLAVVCLAGCGGEESTYTDEGGGGGGGAVTGILLNLQRPAGETGAKAARQWQVLTPDGTIYFTNKNCPTGVLGPVVAFKRADALKDSNRLAKLGDNFMELRISKAEHDEDSKLCSYYLDAASMAETQAGNFMSLLQDGKVVMLFGRDGQ